MYPASNAGRAWKSSPKRMSLGSARSAACRTRGMSGLSAPSDRRKKFPVGRESDREPTACEFCATLRHSQTPTLVPTGPHPGGTFFFVAAALSAHDPLATLLRAGGARISPANARKVFRAQRSQGRIYDVRSAWVVTIPPSDSTWSRWSPSGTLFRGSFFLGLSQKLTSTPRPLLRSGAPFLLAPCRARCRRDTPLAFHSISEERLRYTVACKHRGSRGLQVDG
jgi:hypothetical protein